MRENFALRYAFSIGFVMAANTPASTVFWSAFRFSDTVELCQRGQASLGDDTDTRRETRSKPRKKRPLSVEHRHVGGTGERARRHPGNSICSDKIRLVPTVTRKQPPPGVSDRN